MVNWKAIGAGTAAAALLSGGVFIGYKMRGDRVVTKTETKEVDKEIYDTSGKTGAYKTYTNKDLAIRGAKLWDNWLSVYKRLDVGSATWLYCKDMVDDGTFDKPVEPADEFLLVLDSKHAKDVKEGDAVYIDHAEAKKLMKSFEVFAGERLAARVPGELFKVSRK